MNQVWPDLAFAGEVENMLTGSAGWLYLLSTPYVSDRFRRWTHETGSRTSP